MVVRTAVLALAALMVASCDAPTVPVEPPGYDPRLAGVDLFYHWPLGHTISVYVHTNGAPQGYDLVEAVRLANDLWRDALRYGEFDIRFVSSPSAADVVFHFDTDSVVSSSTCTAPGSGAPGVTYFCVDDQFENIVALPLLGGGQSRVKFDVRITSDVNAIPNEQHFQRIVTHEFGHVVGIGRHSGDNGDLMFAAPQVNAPSGADARTLRYLLHQPADLEP
jgi:hypothetical protein